MNEIFACGITAAVALVLLWLRGRTEAKLMKERDTARTDAKEQSIKAEAKATETRIRQEQQSREDVIHAADSKGVATELDNLFDK